MRISPCSTEFTQFFQHQNAICKTSVRRFRVYRFASITTSHETTMIHSRHRHRPSLCRCRGFFVVLWLVFLAWLAAGAESRAAESGEPFRNVVYAERGDGADAVKLLCDIHVPPGDGPFPAVLCVHGGAWRLGSKEHMQHVARKLTARGYVAVSINYRLAPKHPFPAQQQDCHDALRWMHENAAKYKIDAARIAAIGYSAGAQMVTLEALAGVQADRPAWASGSGDWPGVRLRAVVAGGTPCDFRGLPQDSRGLAYWLGGTRREFPDRYVAASPAAFVSADSPPIYFFHGEDDVLVPRGGMVAFAEQLRKAGVVVQVDLIPENGHLTAFFNDQAYDRAIDFLERRLASEEQ
jgi:acetyl esterase/lipase